MKKVLVLDDTKNIRILLTKCLELEGYEVLAASDGQQALDLFKFHKFDLAFIDIKMPNMSGTEVIKRIREAGINTPVIIITAYATIKNAVECTQMGSIAYIQKPFTADKVRSTLNEVFGSIYINAKSYSLEKVEEALNMGEYQPAMDVLRLAISTETTNERVYFLLSKAYEGMGDRRNAKKFKQMYEVLLDN